MTRIIPIPIHILAIAFSAALSLSTRAAIPWSEELTVSGNIPPPFDSATVFPSANATGYGLLGSSPGERDHITSFARFDEAGTPEWALFLDAGSASREVELIGDFDNATRAFAGYVDENLALARFGLFSGINGSAVYARDVSLPSSQTNASLRFFPDSIAAVVQESGTNMRVLTVGPEGSTLFEKNYASPLFGVSPGLLSFVRDKTLTQLPDRTGYILSVRMSGLVFELVPPFANYSSNRVVTVCLNRDGTIRWSRLFAFATGITPARDLNIAADGSVHYVFLDSVGPRTHLLKLGPDGSLAWARTLDNVRLPVINFGPGSTILLSGSRPATVSPGTLDTDFLIARLNFSSGALEAQAALRGGSINGGSVVGSKADRVYWIMQSADPGRFEEQTSYLGHLTLNLTTPILKRYVKTVTFASATYRSSDQSIVYSPFDLPTAAVRVISMDQHLVPTIDCGLFENATVLVDNAPLSSRGWGITITDIPISADNVASTISVSTLRPAVLTLTELALCSSPAIPTLSIVAGSPGQATLSWTPSIPGFVLQERASLVQGEWSNSPTGATNPVTLPATSPTRFYRLFKP